MRRSNLLRRVGVLLVVGCVGSLGSATAQDTQPAAPAATQPSERAPIKACVLDVQGDVQHAPLDSSEWVPCAVGDEYPEQTIIRTGIRSTVKFRIGEDDTYTALVVDSASKVVLSEAYRTADLKRVRVGVGYGRIRAGVAEGGLESDFTVDSPVATLSKRGTWDFGLFYERGTDRFEIFLLDQGLVEALDLVSGRRRTVLPREFVNQAMLRWMDQVNFVRNVPVPDILGQGDIAVAFNRLRTNGLGVLDPEGGSAILLDLSSGRAQAAFVDMLPPTIAPAPPGRPSRPEGYFGTGRLDELIPLIVESSSPLVQQGFAKPGRYTFRRSALENWLAEHRR